MRHSNLDYKSIKILIILVIVGNIAYHAGVYILGILAVIALFLYTINWFNK